MSDIVFETFGNTNTKFEKTRYVDLSFGMRTVRLLAPPVRVFVHFVKDRGMFKCLGRDCPVCKINKSLQTDYPEDFRKQQGYNASNPRHYINVMDRTFVKVCASCGAENYKDALYQFPNTCSKCGTIISEILPAPSNKVKVLNLSQTNADKLMNYRLAVRDEHDEPLGLGNFDIDVVIVTAGSKKDISVQPSSSPTSREKVSFEESDLYDLNKITLELSSEEIVQFLKGVSIKDLFAARKAETVTETDKPSEAAVKSIEDTLKALGF